MPLDGPTLRQKDNFTVFEKKKVKPWSQDWLIGTGAYPGFCSMKRLCPTQVTSLQFVRFPQQFTGTHLYSWPGWREALWELPKNTTQCPWLGLEPGPLVPGKSSLTIRPLPLPYSWRPLWYCRVNEPSWHYNNFIYATKAVRSASTRSPPASLEGQDNCKMVL